MACLCFRRVAASVAPFRALAELMSAPDGCTKNPIALGGRGAPNKDAFRPKIAVTKTTLYGTLIL
jgi:hypothetical protein